MRLVHTGSDPTHAAIGAPEAAAAHGLVVLQRGIAGASDQEAVLEMGGSQAQSSESRVTEASVRGFWKAYRSNMGV